VRIAYVSRIPDSKKALMEAREAEKSGGGQGDKAAGTLVMAKLAPGAGRPHATLQMQDPVLDAMARKRALIAQIATSQKAEMDAQAASAGSAGADAAAKAPAARTVDAAPSAS
jgi:hypothetical protein